MKRLMSRCAVMAVVMLATNALTAAEPTIKGSVQGIELCPQYICQSAIFVGTFVGTADGRFAVGT